MMAVRAGVNLLLRLKTVGLVSRRGVFRSIAALYNDFEMRTVVSHQFAIQVVTIVTIVHIVWLPIGQLPPTTASPDAISLARIKPATRP
jgi:hypothetical protein